MIDIFPKLPPQSIFIKIGPDMNVGKSRVDSKSSGSQMESFEQGAKRGARSDNGKNGGSDVREDGLIMGRPKASGAGTSSDGNSASC